MATQTAPQPFKSQAMRRYDTLQAALLANLARIEAERAAKFEQILDLEHDLNGAKTSLLFAPSGLPDHLWWSRKRAVTRAQQALFAAVEALTPFEAAAFGKYRLTAR
jgi:hypothetical protein